MQLHYRIKNRHQQASLVSFTGKHARQNKLMNIRHYVDEMLENGIIAMKTMTRQKIYTRQIGSSMIYKIRKLKQREIGLLETFLYEAIFIPEGAQAPPRDIIKHPDLQIYISDFGKKNDICYVAEVDNKVTGAVWTRIINDYSHIDEETPSLSISLLKEYRNLGVGTALMNQILLTLKERKYNKVSLSVQKANQAVRMYEKLGFEVAHENEEDYIMICTL